MAVLNGYTKEWKNPKVAIVILAMLLVAVIVIIAMLRDRIVNTPQWQVTVNGEGRVTYVPDIANVTLGVQIDREQEPDVALTKLSEKITAIINSVAQVGIPSEDIQTQNYTLYPQYDYTNGNSRLVGYSANEQLIVKVRNIDASNTAVGNVVSAASQAGANQILGVAFDVSNVEALKQQARLNAIADARSKAGALAHATDVRLDDIVGWWENIVQAPGNPPQPYYADGKGGIGAGGGTTAAPSVPNGNQEIVIDVGVNYRIR